MLDILILLIQLMNGDRAVIPSPDLGHTQTCVDTQPIDRRMRDINFDREVWCGMLRKVQSVQATHAIQVGQIETKIGFHAMLGFLLLVRCRGKATDPNIEFLRDAGNEQSEEPLQPFVFG